MIRVLLAILLFLSTIFANATFENFDKNFKNAPKQTKQKIHNELKNLYVKSLVGNDLELQKGALNRLIISSKALNLNANEYQKDLADLSKQATTKLPYLLSATKGENALVLKFNQPILAKNIKIFTLNDKNGFRNVIDINAILNGKPLSYTNFITKEINIAQNNKQTIRIVFKDKAQKNIDAKIDENLLIIATKNFISNESLTKPIAKQKPLPQKAQPKQVRALKTIVIDPGHGGTDPGAINGKLQEKTAVLQVAKRLGNELKSRGYKIFYTRDNDFFINLRSRTKMANDKSADLFVSIHANAAPNAQKAATMRGVETFFLSPARSERSKNAAALENKSDIEEMDFFSKQTFLNFLNREKIIASNKLGIDIQSQILSSLKNKRYQVIDGGVREAPFWVLVGALMPAVLIEIGYITHPVEGKMLFDERYQESLAQGIANGVDEYFNKNK
ncbi:N-acetylmuramoyl-L-alanine amidase [Campylobacter gastrosuis]|uniref:N-acetylmuramoyl-L-alanine amidase n=1 Tax=Campylobacter gastrosuis TaxID=2974576 RepID=A0ABT7HNF5_9BACT|nr:N-acetylmuramoyl-L-alanine amidase [Campylobacter gastrosuis]MDL0088438.1 N-acetylmuramoyl-L-alanine amidase [Campylobacter gastrosuis]